MMKSLNNRNLISKVVDKRRIRCTQIRTKNPSGFPLRGKIFVPGRSIVRLGSQTPTQQAFPKSYGRYPIAELNTVESILNSRDKLRMKNCFHSFDYLSHHHHDLSSTFNYQKAKTSPPEISPWKK